MTSPPASSPPPAAEPADFHPNTFPLDPGLRLLEASAGTGKTFALAHLALRLVTERAIPLRRLLVVTFTDAAASELRERIGRRLQEALGCLRDPAREPPDTVLAEWLVRQRTGDAEGEAVAEMRLLLALEDLNGADITTIHGFCQRSLRRHALEARRPPELVLDREGDTLLQQVVHSYWQEQVLRLPPSLIQGLRRKGMKPEALTALLRDLDGDPGLELDPLPSSLTIDTDLAEALPRLWEERWGTFREAWGQGGEELMGALFDQAREWKAANLAYKPYVLKETSRWNRAAVEALIAGGVPGYATVLEREMLTTFLHPGTFCKTARALEHPLDRPITLPHRPLMEAVAELVDGPAELALLHGCHWGRRELTRRRQRLGLCSYAQLLSDLDPGPEAAAPTPLLAAVAAGYSAALIDEFQDTDPIQWRILRLAFGAGRHLLVMVGDPKQAIYRFRGGDLDTYLAARARADGIYAMRENRRSTPELIEALNRLCGRGLVRSRLTPLPLQEARANRGGDGQTPVDLLWLGGTWPTGDKGASPSERDTAEPDPAERDPAERDLAKAHPASARPVGLPTTTELNARLPGQMASTVSHLLRHPPPLREGGVDRPLEPADVCLLVSTHAQAEALRQALRQQGIPCRLVSQADVYATPAATALQRLLDALADPSDPNRLRLLAASPLLGWSAEAIATAPPLRWSDLAGRLQRLALDWSRQGLLGPLTAMLEAEAIARLSTGGRFLADLWQVAELTQQRLHRDRLAPQAAARWLRRRRLREVDTLPEAEQTHSDKVRQAVSVVTVHRSKGLEYPLVICPYLWLDAGRGQGEGRRWQPEAGGAPRLDLHRNRHWGPGWRAERDARRKDEAERERLAYVALTRAMHRLVLAWVPVQGRPCGPLTPWLFAEDAPLEPEDSWPDTDLERWRQRLEEEIARRRLPLRLLDPPPPPAPGQGPVGADPAWAPGALGVGPTPAQPLPRGWARSSYTSWTHDRSPLASPAVTLEEGRDVGDPDSGEASVPPASPPAEAAPSPWPVRGPWADLPSGSGFGDCLHRLLEPLDYGADLKDARSRSLAAHELRRAGLPDTLAEPLLEAVRQLLATPFGGGLGALRPADLPPHRRLNELHFDLSLREARAEALAEAFRRHPGGLFGAAYADALARLPVRHRGFLTGSMDLVFPATEGDQERWWVLDWKSNRLGRRDERGQCLSCGPGDYGPEALRDLMVSHHYPLQAHLYLVALHRYLAWRLPGYDPRRHLGGYVYVFVRGTPGSAAADLLPGPIPGMLVERPPLERLLALDGALGSAPPAWRPGTLP